MEPKMIVFTMMTFLHDLFTAVWVGGLMATALAVFPTVRKQLGRGPKRKQFMTGFQKKLRIPVYISIGGLIITGILMSRQSSMFQGYFHWDNRYSTVLSLKHVLVLLMIAATVVRSLALGGPPAMPGEKPGNPAIPRASSRDSHAFAPSAKERISMALLLVNVALGIGVLFLSALSSVISG